MEIDGASLYLKQGENLNFEESRFLKFKITATDTSDPQLSYTTPDPLKINVDFSYSSGRPYVHFKTTDGGYFDSDVVAADTDSFIVRFKTSPSLIGKWQVYDYKPYQLSDYADEANVIAAATVQANDNGILEFRLRDFDVEHLGWNLYKSKLSINNEGRWDSGEPFDFGVGIPSHSYTFDHIVSDSYLSSTFSHEASVTGIPQRAPAVSWEKQWTSAKGI